MAANDQPYRMIAAGLITLFALVIGIVLDRIADDITKLEGSINQVNMQQNSRRTALHDLMNSRREKLIERYNRESAKSRAWDVLVCAEINRLRAEHDLEEFLECSDRVIGTD